MRTGRFKIGIGLAIAALVMILLCCLTPIRAIFDQTFLVMQLEMLGHYAASWFVLAHLIATVIGIPGTILTVAGGVVFGLVWGTIWSVIGATLGAIGAFWLARTLLHHWAERYFGYHPILQRCKQAAICNPLSFVLALRFAPISPFNVVNFLLGLTPIPFKSYAVGTFVGIIPGTFAYTWLGVTGKQAWQGDDRLSFVLALGLLTLISVLPMYLRQRNTRN